VTVSIRRGVRALALSLFFLVLAGASDVRATSITVGTFSGGNCYPFMCNDSGTDVGPSLDYQQVYSADAFGHPLQITSIDWYFDSTDGGSPIVLGGDYAFSWGYAPAGSVNNLDPNLLSYSGGPFSLGTMSVPAGGADYGALLTLNGFAPFVYDPSLGDLLLEVAVSNQDNVPNYSANGYNQEDDAGVATSRAFYLQGVINYADNVGLVTTFNGDTVPEPSSLLLLGGGLVALVKGRRRLGIRYERRR